RRRERDGADAGNRAGQGSRQQGARPAGDEPPDGSDAQARAADRQGRPLRELTADRPGDGREQGPDRRCAPAARRGAGGGPEAMRRTLLAVLIAAACKREGRPPSLGEAISVEQPGGSASQLFSQGSEIPTSATESFTTGKDNEKRILIHLLHGKGRSADKLHSDGWWAVDGISAAKAGEPRVLVTFEVD